MGNRFTAIYVDSWMTGSYRYSETKMIRIEQQDGETVIDMLKREDIDFSTVYLFQGHPLLQGEKVSYE